MVLNYAILITWKEIPQRRKVMIKTTKELEENLKTFAEHYGMKVKVITKDEKYVSVAFTVKSVNRVAYVVEYRVCDITDAFELYNFYPMFSSAYIDIEKLIGICR